MRAISSNEARRLTGNSDLKKGLVAWVRQRIGQWGGSYEGPTVFDRIQQSGDFVDPEPELGTAKDFVVFGQDASVEAKRQRAGRNHAHDLGAWSEWRQEASHQNVRVQDDLHRDRFRRTALISASISSLEI